MKFRRRFFTLTGAIIIFVVLLLNTLIVGKLFYVLPSKHTDYMPRADKRQYHHPTDDGERLVGARGGAAAQPVVLRKHQHLANDSNYTSGGGASPERDKQVHSDRDSIRPEERKTESDDAWLLDLDKNVTTSRPLVGGDSYGNGSETIIGELIDMVRRYFQRRDGNRILRGSEKHRTSQTLAHVFREYGDLTKRTNWEQFYLNINSEALYDPDDSTLEGLLKDMATLQIDEVEMKSGGTQLKLTITFENEGRALFKPMRFSRERETLPNHFYFVDFERHNAEIAAFHLDRILEFYRVPPVVGRVINITHDIKRLAEKKLAKTFFISPANNVCFHGICSYYCDTSHAICGNPDMLEGSFAILLPSQKIAPRKTWKNPWRRSYSKHRKAVWEVFEDYCEHVRRKPMYRSGRRFLDIMDISVFDFLMGNMDRHHFETFTDFGNETYLIHLDNGRAFGKSKHDEISILAPMYQCCLIRFSTLTKLIKFYEGPLNLSDLMRKSLALDNVNPVLTELHLLALDRRVSFVLKTVYNCIAKGNKITNVIINDKL